MFEEPIAPDLGERCPSCGEIEESDKIVFVGDDYEDGRYLWLCQNCGKEFDTRR